MNDSIMLGSVTPISCTARGGWPKGRFQWWLGGGDSKENDQLSLESHLEPAVELQGGGPMQSDVSQVEERGIIKTEADRLFMQDCSKIK